jgi:transcriptional regulator with GAF, ATPase, and Fis domain
MMEVYAMTRRVAASNASVLLVGETGTGKELVARTIHRLSERVAGPFIAENCGAFSEGVLASELFGHERGAFTGAAARRRGLFEQADGGTLFLDEIADTSPRVQVSLLRVLQEGTLRRVGAEQPITVDVRVIAATHRDLSALVAKGEFREDLYYRLCGATVRVPPLRERLGDLEGLVRHFLAELGATKLWPDAAAWRRLRACASRISRRSWAAGWHRRSSRAGCRGSPLGRRPSRRRPAPSSASASRRRSSARGVWPGQRGRWGSIATR